MSARWGDRGDRGAAAVEAALVICFIVVPLTFGVISYAYMLSFRQSVSQATTEGARAAAVAPPGSTSPDQPAKNRTAVQQAINAALGNGVTCDLGSTSLMRDGKQVGTCTLSTPASCSTCKQVTIDYHYADHPMLPSFGMGILLPDNLSYTASAEVSQ